ncbi:putative metal-binding motif-containing protein [Corallococcus sp. BB11-1]|uniref:putative metal-binding motif-containing protein n=1 Tax=Corallococcus sp. BB11-1 TaxID=2996783 RepID=UPI00226F27FB|nr:putative metal-binding motif-containing protein [Corallococcus sp. BB11-1]MCY1033827.1 putative metal-binding motif-containing protein [Corallococcus sp. BB11-1]
MYRLCLLGFVVLLGACGEKAPEDGALRVSVEYGSYKPACVRVEVQDTQRPRGATDIVQGQFKNDATKTVLVAVLRKPEWGRELTVSVSSFANIDGTRCAGPAVEQFTSEAPIAIPPREFARFDVKLVAVDTDEDGSPSAVGLSWAGASDCDDSRKDVRPGAAEQCDETTDYDCDGLKACADRDCAEKTCTGGDKCTTNKRCIGVGAAAECGGGVPVVCDQSPNLCAPRLSCESSTGECVPGPVPVGMACDSGDKCVPTASCNANSQCDGPSLVCPPNMSSVCQAEAGTCDSTSGLCRYEPKPAMTVCTDADPCTATSSCDGQGACVGTVEACSAPVCQRVFSGCVAQNNCQFEPDPAQLNTLCGESPSGRPRVCDATGACVPFPYPTSNFPANEIQAADIRTLITTGNVMFDTDNGEFGTWTPAEAVVNLAQLQVLPITQGDGIPSALLIPVRTLELGGTLRIVGSRPVILAVFGDATLNHPILVSGRFENGTMVPGAGGQQVCTGIAGTNGSYVNNWGGGGGGAGGGTPGAAGGTGVGGAVQGLAGGARVSAPIPLLGGCAGGAGGGMSGVLGGMGGAGGGAVQISVSRTLTVATHISASAAAGLGGRAQASGPSAASGGGGGGSGGLVVLEAFQLNLTGNARLTANGGGGGEGAEAPLVLGGPTNDGAAGTNGSETENSVASGGDGTPFYGGSGGNGGAGITAPTTGQDGTTLVLLGSGAGGGGGGAAGRIHLRSLQPCAPLQGAVISPPAPDVCPLP